MAPREKKESEKRKNIVCVKLTDIELSILDQHADGVRLSRSEYIRGLILNKKMTAKYQIVINSDDIRELLMRTGKSVLTSIRLQNILIQVVKGLWRWKKKFITAWQIFFL